MFRKHYIRFETTDLAQGDSLCIAHIKAADYHNTGATDTTGDVDNLTSLNTSPEQNERYMVTTGPCTVHGYSLRVWGNFLGSVYQGLSRFDSALTSDDKNNVETHQYRTSATINTTSTSDLEEESAIKNVTYLKGWKAQVEAGGTGISQSLGYAHLQKKFSRRKMKYVGSGKYTKTAKSGFVLVPNTETEYITWNVKHILPQGFANMNMYVDMVIWMSFDQN